MAQNERDEALQKLRKALLVHKEVDAKVHASTPKRARLGPAEPRSAR